MTVFQVVSYAVAAAIICAAGAVLITLIKSSHR